MYESRATHLADDSDPAMDPPIQEEYTLSSGAATLVLIVGGARWLKSHCKRVGKPGIVEVFPDSRTLFQNMLRLSISVDAIQS
mmetsp:Transcript_145598/g.267603  ORF Transcript_145598/g.267603 Transcript_145598/m.267603 type:complete len:83 (+) Transcript_145598:40-288(+)